MSAIAALALEGARLSGELLRVARRINLLLTLLAGAALAAALVVAAPLTVAGVSLVKFLYGLCWLVYRYAPPALIAGSG